MLKGSLDGGFDLRRGQPGIDDLDGIIGGRQLEVTLAGTFKEADLLQLNPVQLAAMAGPLDRKSTRLNSSHLKLSRMPSSA